MRRRQHASRVDLHLPAEVFAKVQRFARKEHVSLSRAIERLTKDLGGTEKLDGE